MIKGLNKWNILVCLVIFGFVVVPTAMADSPYKLKYSTSTMAGFDIPVLNLVISGVPDDLVIILSDPDKNTVGEAFVSKADLIDGTETVELWMVNHPGETPKQGTYSILLMPYNSETVYRSNITFSGAKLRVADAQYDKNWEFWNNGWSIGRAKFRVLNEGDLPAIINRIVMVIDGSREEHDLYSLGYGISPGEDRVLVEYPMIDGLGNGTHTVTVTIYSKNMVLASHTSWIVLGIKTTPVVPKTASTPKSTGFELVSSVAGLLILVLLCRGRR